MVGSIPAAFSIKTTKNNMGEIADMMLDGTLDSVTGEYLGDPCGYPRSTEDDSYRPKSIRAMKKGIKKFVNHRYPQINYVDVVKIYWKDHLNLQPSRINDQVEVISKDFNEFKKWFKTFKIAVVS